MILGIDASRANHTKRGGVEWYSYHIIEGLKRVVPDDVEVRLYSDVSLTGDLARLPHNWHEKILAWPLRRLWTHARLSFEMLTNPPDVLFIPAHVPPLIHPKKTVMMVHDVAAMRFPEAYNLFERLYSLASARYALRNLPLVLTPSEFTKHELSRLCAGASDDKIKVIHHGYDPLYHRIQDKAEVRQALERLGLTQPFLLSVGRLETKKNTVGIIRAYEIARKKLPELDFKLVLVGSPGYGYEDALKAINSSQYRSDIVQLNWLSTKDMVYLYNGASALVFPSYYEGFGLPLLEAMACGTPVIASRGSSLPEVGGDAVVYIDPFETAALVQALEQLLTEQKKQTELSSAGLVRASAFSWEKAVYKTWRALSDLLQ